LYAVDPVGVATIKPSARTRITSSSPMQTTSSMMRDRAALVMTTSFNTISSAKVLPPRSVRACSIIRSSMGAVPSSTASSDG
jgi:hypothetical protein